MAALKVTNALKVDIQKHYGLKDPVVAAEVRAEYNRLARRGLWGISTPRHEALRNIFAKHGADPVHGGYK